MFKIINHRNNCYLNTILQLFLNSKVKNLVLSILTGINNNIIDPSNILKLLSNDIDIKIQNDAHEAFIKLIDKIPKLKPYFEGIIKYEFLCNNCNIKRKKYEIFYSLILYDTNIKNNFKNSLETESCNIFCDVCNCNTFTNKKNIYKKLPDILVFFNILKLDIEIFNNLIINNKNYILIAIIKHIGNQNNGHYFFIDIKNQVTYDDMNITKNESIDNKNSYLIIYELEDTI